MESAPGGGRLTYLLSFPAREGQVPFNGTCPWQGAEWLPIGTLYTKGRVM